MTFTEYLQKECGMYSLREILDNFDDFQIEEAVQDYLQQQVKNLNIPAVMACANRKICNPYDLNSIAAERKRINKHKP